MSHAGDWPQILGPSRTGMATGEVLMSSWPKAGPELLWSRPVGQSNAGVAVQGDIGVVFHRLDNREVIEAIRVDSGEPLWNVSYPTSFVPSVGSEDGPLCVPTIDGQQVVTFGAQGILTCCNLVTGEQQWQRDTHKDFEALPGYFGVGSSPLVLADRVVVNVGGHKTEAGIVAFSRESGETLWHGTDERASYAAPILTMIAGRPTVICIARTRCLGLSPEDGEIHFDLPFGRMGPTVSAALPVVLDDQLFLTASYSIGAVSARLSADGAEELWRRRDSLASQYTTPILHNGVLYAIDGRQDGPPADLVCLDPKTGDRIWGETSFGYATLIGAGGRLIAVKTDGELVLMNADPEKFDPLSRHRVTSKILRALPALASGRLYVRDTDTLYCLKVGGVE
ncbi:MAG: PQQ-binding-like beta-propeller repeat protein [Planctomycetaceae bacterium]|nr:PQQ-binding-like beta-propeller repeat protein [Planctomycetaceae bacterium]